MEKLGTNITSICNAFKPYAGIFAGACFLVIGILLLIPSEKTHKMGITAIPWTIAGVICIVGSTYLGDWFYKKVEF